MYVYNVRLCVRAVAVGLIAWQRGEGQEHYHKVSFVFNNLQSSEQVRPHPTLGHLCCVGVSNAFLNVTTLCRPHLYIVLIAWTVL